jgi:AraC-like DNA-binding protein
LSSEGDALAEFRSSFLNGPLAALAGLRAGPVDPHLRTVRAAAGYIDRNLKRRITLAELTKVSGVGQRSIQSAFNKRFGYSPWTYLRIRRLERARRLLADLNCRLSVAEIAVESGFNHFSQFARDYREYFGDTPKRTSFLSRVGGNRWQATLQLAASSAKPIRRYIERLLAG